MTAWSAISAVISIAWNLFQMLYGNSLAQAAAQAAVVNQFSLLEQQGQPVLRNIVVALGKTTFEDWGSVPTTPPAAGSGAGVGE